MRDRVGENGKSDLMACVYSHTRGVSAVVKRGSAFPGASGPCARHYTRYTSDLFLCIYPEWLSHFTTYACLYTHMNIYLAYTTVCFEAGEATDGNFECPQPLSSRLSQSMYIRILCTVGSLQQLQVRATSTENINRSKMAIRQKPLLVIIH